jgi:hypothetical protein
MLRKFILYLILAIVIAAIGYGVMTYAIVGLYEPSTPKVSYVFIVEKPQRGWEVFFNHIDKRAVENEVKKLRDKGQPVPWHLDYNYGVNNSVYQITMDNRKLSD